MEKFFDWLTDKFTSPFSLIFLIFGFLLILLGAVASINTPYFNIALLPYDSFRTGIIILGIIFIVFAIIFQIKSQGKSVEKSTHEFKPASKKNLSSTLLFLSDGIDLLNEVEQKSIGKEIWVISPDLKNDTGQEEIDITPDIVLQNVSTRGITYTYIVPRTDEIHMALKQLEAMLGDYPDRLQVIQIKAEQFRNLAISEWVIYNPRLVDGKFPDVFMQLPDGSYQWWVKVSDEIASVFLDRVSKIMEENGYL